LYKDSFKLQTMTALIKSFCRGVQGGRFFQKESPLAAGGKDLRFVKSFYEMHIILSNDLTK
jgi:hypothetical protein